MKIAFIGQKGIPAQWGGVEAHVEALAGELAQRGHEVAVYVRRWYVSDGAASYNNINLVRTPTIHTKHLDAFAHGLSSSIHALGQHYDIIHYQAIGPAFFSWIPKLKSKIVCTIHRYDYEADKWGGFAKGFLKLSEKIALRVPHRTIVVAKYQRAFYETLGFKVDYIPNGVRIPATKPANEITAKFGLRTKDYILSMGRLVPEKRPDWLIKAYKQIPASVSKPKLVIAGGSSATDEYVNQLKAEAAGDNSIVFTGYVQGDLKAELLSNAKLFLIPSALEGLPIALLEAMSYGLSCLASDIPAHREILGDNNFGRLFDTKNITALKQQLEILIKGASADFGQGAREFMISEYNWPTIAERTEALYRSILTN